MRYITSSKFCLRYIPGQQFTAVVSCENYTATTLLVWVLSKHYFQWILITVGEIFVMPALYDNCDSLRFPTISACTNIYQYMYYNTSYSHSPAYQFQYVTTYETLANDISKLYDIVETQNWSRTPRKWFNTNTPSYQYTISHCKYKIVLWLSYHLPFYVFNAFGSATCY